MALSDIYKCTDYQRLPSGEQILNVYFYERVGVTGDASDLIATFVSDMLSAVKGVQSSALVHYLARVENLGDVGDFDEFTAAGDVGDLTAPLRNEWDAYAFTLRPSTRDVRPGSKRIGGVAENDAGYTNGVVTDAAILTLLQTVRTQLGAILSGTLDTYIPVIIKRVLVAGNYRLPVNDAELMSIPVSQVLLNPKITHQTSRGNSR